MKVFDLEDKETVEKKLYCSEFNRRKVLFMNKGIIFFLYNLKELNLRYNSISLINGGLFQYLVSLEYLSIDSNKIDFSDEIASAFYGLKNLMRLDLSHNSITELPRDIFQDLICMSFLNLSYNKISSLDENIFEGLDDLTQVILKSNPTCDIPQRLESIAKRLERKERCYDENY